MFLKLIPLEERIVLDAAVAAVVTHAPVNLHAFDNTPTVFVDQNASGTVHNGQSWKTAYLDLQTALQNATRPEKILMAGGTYSPGSSPGATYNLPNNVLIVGGARGGATILSGLINGGGNITTIVTANGVTDILENLTISDGLNSTTGRGGGLLETNGSNILLQNDIFTHNSTTFTLAETGGGAIYSTNSILAISDCQFLKNSTAQDGGAVFADHDTFVNIANSSFANNTAQVAGGAAFLLGVLTSGNFGDVIFSNDSFLNNISTSNRTDFFPFGGALSFEDLNTATVSSSTFINNSVSDPTFFAQGGAISSGFNNSLTVTGSLFLNNNGASFGGAISDVGDLNVNISKNIFTGNSATNPAFGGGFGGALDVEPLIGNYVVQNNLFLHNTALFGGALDTSFESGPVSITGNLFIGNTATIQGGAIWDGFDTGIPLTITGNFFVANSAPQGTAIWLDGTATVNGETSPAQILNQLVADNLALSGDDIFI